MRLTCQLYNVLVAQSAESTSKLSVAFNAESECSGKIMPADVEFCASPGLNTIDFLFYKYVMTDICINGQVVKRGAIAPGCFSGDAFVVETDKPITGESITLDDGLGNVTTGKDVGIFITDKTVMRGCNVTLKSVCGTISARIKIIKPSQLSIYIIPETELHVDDTLYLRLPTCHSIALAHDEQNNCSIYRDIHINGQWISEKRIKLSYFKYQEDVPYHVTINTGGGRASFMVNANSASATSARIYNVIDLPFDEEAKCAIAMETYGCGSYTIDDILASVDVSEAQNNRASSFPSSHETSESDGEKTPCTSPSLLPA